MRTFYIISAVLAVNAVHAQSYPKMVTYKDAQQPALILQLPNTPDVAEQTILNKLKSTGYKPETKGKLFWKSNKKEGYYVFPGVQLPEMEANQWLDMYFKVDAQKNDPQYKSAITLLVARGAENFLNPQVDSLTYHATQDFLNSFVSETASFKLNKDLEAQKEKVKDSEKKWQDLKNQQEDAKKKIAGLEANLKEWQDAEVRQKTDLDSARIRLQDLENQQGAVPAGTTK